MKETQCTRDILTYLDTIGIFAWRNNTGVLRGMSGHWVRFGYPGSADIIGLLPSGKFLAIEDKANGAKMSDDQEAFKYLIEFNKGIYLTVVSLDDLVRQLSEL